MLMLMIMLSTLGAESYLSASISDLIDFNRLPASGIPKNQRPKKVDLVDIKKVYRVLVQSTCTEYLYRVRMTDIFFDSNLYSYSII